MPKTHSHKLLNIPYGKICYNPLGLNLNKPVINSPEQKEFQQMQKTDYRKISSFLADSLPFLLLPDLYFKTPQPWSLSLQGNLEQGAPN